MNKIMKPATVALAFGFALVSTFAFAITSHHRSAAGNRRGTAGMVHPNPGGPAAFRGPAKNYAVPGWSDEQTQNWIDNATGPKD